MFFQVSLSVDHWDVHQPLFPWIASGRGLEWSTRVPPVLPCSTPPIAISAELDSTWAFDDLQNLHWTADLSASANDPTTPRLVLADERAETSHLRPKNLLNAHKVTDWLPLTEDELIRHTGRRFRRGDASHTLFQTASSNRNRMLSPPGRDSMQQYVDWAKDVPASRHMFRLIQ